MEVTFYCMLLNIFYKLPRWYNFKLAIHERGKLPLEQVVNKTRDEVNRQPSTCNCPFPSDILAAQTRLRYVLLKMMACCTPTSVNLEGINSSLDYVSTNLFFPEEYSFLISFTVSDKNNINGN